MYLDAVNRFRTSENGVSQQTPKTPAGASAFGAQLSAVKNSAKTGSITVPLKDENYIYYIGHGDGQYVYIEYADVSAPDDPTVRIQGRSSEGAFDFIRRVQDIDPANASYAELCALVGYQNQSAGHSSPSALGILRPLPLGMQVGDFLTKTDYVSASARYLSAENLTSSMYRQGMELLEFYQSVLSKTLLSAASRKP